MKYKVYLKSILMPLILGAIVGFITSKSMDYSTLVKPVLAPPSILFPIVWSILYILMGVSYGILKTNRISEESKKIYYLQLGVNLLWSIIFFIFGLLSGLGIVHILIKSFNSSEYSFDNSISKPFLYVANISKYSLDLILI